MKYILSAYHRQVIGRMLLRSIMEWLIGKGYSSMMLWILDENPACKFYENIGGRKSVYEDDRTIKCGDELVNKKYYHWDELEELLRNLSGT